MYRSSNDTSDVTTLTVDLTFYDSICQRGVDFEIELSQGDVEVGQKFTGRTLARDLFLTSSNGVVLGRPVRVTDSDGIEHDCPGDSLCDQVRWQMSGLVVDHTLGRTYERQALPLVAVPATFPLSVWAGLTIQSFQDFYIQGDGFSTNLLFLCPRGALQTDMSAIAPVTGANRLVGEVFDADEQLINSFVVTCTCYTENPSALKAIMALNPDMIGTFTANPRFVATGVNEAAAAAGWRTITYNSTGGNPGALDLLGLTQAGLGQIQIVFDGRIRRD